MDVLNGKIKNVYFKYLGAAFGSAMTSCIYSLVDMAMVGQYHGPLGTAAMGVVTPIYNIIYSLGFLTGIGGSVLYSAEKGKGKGKENQYFTLALFATVALAMIAWIGVALFDDELLILFGANETILPLAKDYLYAIKMVLPVFMFNQMIAAYLRNDNAPLLATIAVLTGGVFNVFGDYFFVFTLDMGIKGAGIATAIGAVISLIIMLVHFVKKTNTLKLVKSEQLLIKLKRIFVSGFSTFFVDVAMGILTMLFNRQIMKYLGENALSVYAVVVNISTFVQCCAYSVGQASQPIISVNYGAKQWKRITETLKYALYSVAAFSIIWTLLIFVMPNGFIHIFMSPTEEILSMAPTIMRTYGISFLLLPLNIFSTYYFQSLMKSGTAFVVSVARGAVVSGLFIMVLPIICGADAIWFAMPVTELIVAVYVVCMMVKYTKNKKIA